MDTNIVELAERIKNNLVKNSEASIATVDGTFEDYIIVHDNYHVIHINEGFICKWTAELFDLDMETEAMLKISESSVPGNDFTLLMNFINTSIKVSDTPQAE